MTILKEKNGWRTKYKSSSIGAKERNWPRSRIRESEIPLK